MLVGWTISLQLIKEEVEVEEKIQPVDADAPEQRHTPMSFTDEAKDNQESSMPDIQKAT